MMSMLVGLLFDLMLLRDPVRAGLELGEWLLQFQWFSRVF